MPDENLTGPSVTAPAATTAAAEDTQITAAKFRSLVDAIDAYLQHSHTFNDEYRSNCECQCGRGSI
jgi:hypothetical protein